MQQRESQRARRIRPPPWRTNTSSSKSNSSTNNNTSCTRDTTTSIIANKRETALPIKKHKWLSPVERRRQAAREQLQKTQKLAEVVAAGDGDPKAPKIAHKQEQCSFPKSLTDQKMLSSLKSIILYDTLTKEQTHERIMEITVLSKSVCWNLLSTNIGSTKSSGKKGKKTAKASRPSLEDPITRITPLLIHLAASVNNLEGLECLLYAMPESVEYCNVSGRTPLHIAVLEGYGTMVRSMCVKAPKCLRYLDTKGNLAVHIAVGETSIANFDAPLITSALIANYPRGIFIRDGNGYLPIHLAAKYGFLPGVRALLAVDASSVSMRLKCDDDDALPIDLALKGHLEVTKSISALKEDSQMMSRLRNESYIVGTAAAAAATCSDQNNFIARIRSIALGDDEEDEPSGSGGADHKSLLELKSAYGETIEVLLMSALYTRAVFMPREESHADSVQAPFFLPIHAGLCQRLKRENWVHLLQMYSALHVHQIDRDGRTVLHTLADVSDPHLKGGGTPYPSEELQAMVTEIHALDPTAHSTPDSFGLIPLQLAVLNGAPAPVIQIFTDCGGKDVLRAKWNEPRTMAS